MATYVLVHGAWHGGWCWQRVAPLLRAAGHDVYTPTLTGLGERAHLLVPTIDLALHVQDVLGVLGCEDLQGVILVGHSYGGLVISGVAEQAAPRLAHLVYLDAFVPRHGQALWDLMPPERRAAQQATADATPTPWQLPAPAPSFWGMTDAADVAWVQARLGPQPRQTFTQGVETPTDRTATLPRTYIRCAGYQGPFGPFAERAQREPGWRYHELPTGHDAMVSMPRELAALLLAVADDAPAC